MLQYTWILYTLQCTMLCRCWYWWGAESVRFAGCRCRLHAQVSVVQSWGQREHTWCRRTVYHWLHEDAYVSAHWSGCHNAVHSVTFIMVDFVLFVEPCSRWCFYYILRESTENVLWSRASVCVSVCLSAAVRPHYCTDPDVTWGRGRGSPLVVHYWADM